MSSGTLQMRYNASNRRLQKISGTTINYVRDISEQVLAVYEGTTIEERYVWGPLGLVSIVKGNNTSPTRYYTITDHLGSIRSVVNTGGTAVAGYDNYPFGKELRSSVSGDADSRFKFGAKEFDTQLNLDLYYFEARFYRPDIGRFVSPDPIRKGWSYYSFASNNPWRFTDPTGLISEDECDHSTPIKRDYSGGLASYDSRANMGYTPFLDASQQQIDWWVEWRQYKGMFGEGETTFTLIENAELGKRVVYAREMLDAFKQEIVDWYVRAKWAIDHSAQYGIHVFAGVQNMVDQLSYGDVTIWDFGQQMFDPTGERIMGLWNPRDGGGYSVVLNVTFMDTGTNFSANHITWYMGHEMYHVMKHRITGEGGIDFGVDMMGNYYGANTYGSQVVTFFHWWYTGNLGLPWLDRP